MLIRRDIKELGAQIRGPGTHSEKGAICKPEKEPSYRAAQAGTLISRLPASRTER